MGFFSSPRTRDWSAPRPSVDSYMASSPQPSLYDRLQAPRAMPNHQAGGVDAASFRELNDLSQRMEALQTGMAGLREELHANRRASMSDMPAHMHMPFQPPPPPGHSMPALSPLNQHHRQSSSFQPSSSVLNATAAAQQAADTARHQQYGRASTPQSEASMELDLEGSLRDGRQARARAATWPTSPNLFDRPHPFAQTAPARTPSPRQPVAFDIPSRPRTPSRLPPFTFTRIGMPSAHPVPMADSPPFAMPTSLPSSMPMPGASPNGVPMPGLSFSAAGSMDRSGLPYLPDQNAFQSVSAGMSRPGSPFRAQAAEPRDAFGGVRYQFPDPFSTEQRGQYRHPAYQAGFNLGGHLPSGFGSMAGPMHPFDAGIARGHGVQGMVDAGMQGRPMSPRSACGY